MQYPALHDCKRPLLRRVDDSADTCPLTLGLTTRRRGWTHAHRVNIPRLPIGRTYLMTSEHQPKGVASKNRCK